VLEDKSTLHPLSSYLLFNFFLDLQIVTMYRTNKMVFLFLLAVAALNTVNSLNVHLICHSHDDVGWLSTVDQYYVEQVQYIIDSVISALEANPERKFIYVEQAFFQRWWRAQTDERKDVTRRLVKSGQLEFVNGGWCMHDEAATHFIDMIDQTTLGHRFLLDEFEFVPKTGWQIDPFGHSATQAALLTSEVGLGGLFFARIDHADNDNRRANKALEFLWRASPSFGASAQVFAGAFASGSYGPPAGLCWDINCWLDTAHAIQDDPSMEDYNVPERVETAVRTARDLASIHLGDDIMFTLGNDFEYRAANEWFKNLDKLIRLVNADGRVKIFYSTPTQYLQAKLQSNVSWPLKTDDLFPYSDGPHSYWTGYFTSRPNLKRYIRLNSAFLQVARQIEVWAGGDGNGTALLWDAIATAQHHDAITGTEQQPVASDYALRIARGAAQAADTIHTALAQITTKPGGLLPRFTYCPLSNVSICPPSQSLNNNGTVLVLLIYNSIARARSELIHIPVTSPAFCNVRSVTGSVPVQLAPVMAISALNKSLAAPYRCSFLAKDIPPIGYDTYWLSNQSTTILSHVTTIKQEDPITTIANEFWNLQFNTTTGLLFTAIHIPSNTTIAISQEYLYYASSNDSNPYVFRPLEQSPRPISSYNPVQLEVVSGAVYAEVRQYVTDWMTGSVRLIQGSPVIEFDYTVGPIPIADGLAKEVITRFNTSIRSQGIFYTDSNGREFQQRKRDYRLTWNYTVTEPVSGNYYPMTTAVRIEDTQMSLAVLTDRSQGVSSMSDGSIEIFLHRRTLTGWLPLNDTGDDGRGLVVTGRHLILLNPPQLQADAIRSLQSQVYAPSLVELAPVTITAAEYIDTHRIKDTYLKSPLPDNVDLITLTVHDTDQNRLLIRLAHLFAINDQSGLAQPVTIDMSQLFKRNLLTLKEISLTANQPIENVRKIQQQLSQKTTDTINNTTQRGSLNDTSVTITPMEIRTFLITLE
jgi:alpha-mannosidase